MRPKLERLTYVHDGDPGELGALIKRCGNRLRFGSEGSGLFEVRTHLNPVEARTYEPSEDVFSITMSPTHGLLPELQELVRGAVPCILGHAAGHSAILVNSAAIRRLNGTPSDLRGKIRFGLARVEWTIH